MNETQEQPKEISYEEIVAEYEVSKDPIEIPLPDGRKVRYSPLPTTQSRKQMSERVDALLARIPTVEQKGHRDHWISKIDVPDYADQRFSAELHLRAIEPRMSLETAFRLHRAPTVVAYIKSRLDLADKELLALYYRFRNETAEGKSETSGSEGDSEPLESPSPDAIPTT